MEEQVVFTTENGLVNKIVRAAVMSGPKVIRRTGLRDVIGKSEIEASLTQGAMFTANEQLKRDFGLQLEPLVVVGGDSKKRRASGLEQAREFQIDIRDNQNEKWKGSQQAWVLVSGLPDKYRQHGGSLFEYGSHSQAQLAGMMLAVCTVVAVNGGGRGVATSHEDLVGYLERLGIENNNNNNDYTHVDTLSNPINRLSCQGLILYAVRSDYLVLHKGKDQQDGLFEYTLGKRAQSELDFKGLHKLLGMILPNDKQIDGKLANALWNEIPNNLLHQGQEGQ